MRLADFDYDLPTERIAQEPSPERDRARLLIMDRGSGAVEHRIFSDIDTCLRPGDLLVMNDTKVFPC
ncbi:MAG TPA: S-adenosylmethionine:tRNA ribosyltransferase-isomerase, partial [Nitrospirota bacterium]